MINLYIVMGLQELNINFNSLPKDFSDSLEGSWIAISRGEIIAHNNDFKALFKEIGEKGLSRKVLFHKVPKKEIIIV